MGPCRCRSVRASKQSDSAGASGCAQAPEHQHPDGLIKVGRKMLVAKFAISRTQGGRLDLAGVLSKTRAQGKLDDVLSTNARLASRDLQERWHTIETGGIIHPTPTRQRRHAHDASRT